MPDLSIIIVSYNARADLQRCLESLHAPAPSIAHEVIVIDNQSSDGSAAAARRWLGVTVIEAGSNLGFARGNNLGIRASTGTSLLLLNSDTIVPPGAIDRLIAELDRHPEAAVIGPRLVDGRPQVPSGRRDGRIAKASARFTKNITRGGPPCCGCFCGFADKSKLALDFGLLALAQSLEPEA